MDFYLRKVKSPLLLSLATSVEKKGVFVYLKQKVDAEEKKREGSGMVVEAVDEGCAKSRIG